MISVLSELPCNALPQSSPLDVDIPEGLDGNLREENEEHKEEEEEER